MRPRNIERRNLGFTLIETVVTLLVAAVLFGLGATVISGGFRTYFLGREIMQNDWQGRLALERMTRELRTVRTATNPPIPPGDLNINTGGQITFVDFAGNTIVYRQTGNTIERSQNAGAFQPLADNVSTTSPLSFSYLRNDGVTAEPVVGGLSTNVYYITVSFTVSSTSASAIYRGTVKPTSF
jgi:prepilin-type N-terminal cleavage/methylation domain-containing protein